MRCLQGNKDNKEKLKKITGLWLARPWKMGRDIDRRGKKGSGLPVGWTTKAKV